MISKKYLLAGGITSVLLMGACSSVSADTNLDWEADGSEGTAKTQTSEEVDMEKVEQNAQKAVDEAKKIFDGKVTDVELDEDDGVYYYEVEMNNGKQEYEVDINAETLAIIEEDLDDEDDLDDEADDEFESGSKKNENLKSAEEAVNTAKQRFDGEVESVELDEDGGIHYYEIEMQNGKEEYEVDINAEDLKIIEEDFDREDDDDSDEAREDDKDDSGERDDDDRDDAEEDRDDDDDEDDDE